MTDLQKQIAIYTLQTCRREMLDAAGLSSLAEVDDIAHDIRSRFDADPESVTVEDIYAFLQVMEHIAVPNLKNLHRYWRDLRRSLKTAYYQTSTVSLYGHVMHMYGNTVIFPRN